MTAVSRRPDLVHRSVLRLVWPSPRHAICRVCAWPPNAVVRHQPPRGGFSAAEPLRVAVDLAGYLCSAALRRLPGRGPDLIARLVCADWTEGWWPARAVRW